MQPFTLIIWILASQLVVGSSVRRITEQYKQLIVQIPGYSPTEVIISLIDSINKCVDFRVMTTYPWQSRLSLDT
jgi:hypothetical protein